MGTTIDLNLHRKESKDKVTGYAKYTDDFPVTGYLCAVLLVSPYPHAKIESIDVEKAKASKGVRAVVTGQDFPVLSGPLFEDRPPLAVDKVRYAGEPVAMVVADDEALAQSAVLKISVKYTPLPAVFKPQDALSKDAPVIHDNLMFYKKVVTDVYPSGQTNLNSEYHIRKGNMEIGWQESDVIVEQSFYLPPSDHMAMEVRAARAEISSDGTVSIISSTQAPYTVVKQISSAFGISAGKIAVKVPFVGGGFGGKAPVTLEILAYMASKAVGGRPVRIVITREQDIVSAPGRLALEATVKLGATADGVIKAAELRYLLDCGAYADIGPYMTKAIAADCTGPYNIENLHCDALSIYTNHTYATSYRSFAHESFTFCIERCMDILAGQCHKTALQIRAINAIKPGCYSPTQVLNTTSNTGSIMRCIEKLNEMIDSRCDEPVKVDENTIRATGTACFWKAANPPVNAISGAFVTFNSDGSLNLNTGVVEMGSGSQSTLAQMLADKLKMDINQINVVMDVDTRLNPEHYKTVASLTSYMAGRAVLRAAEDIILQLQQIGSQVFNCLPEEIEVAEQKVYSRQNPQAFIDFKDIVAGYKTSGGQSLGEPVLAKGAFMLKGLTPLDPKTGKGKSGPAWTVGAQAVEIEVDTRTFSYHILNAYTVMDVGKKINPKAMEESIKGGMAMGLSMSSREAYAYTKAGRLKTPNLRTYKLMHLGEEPKYHVELIETPQEDAPFGTRSMSEHGLTAIPAALANAFAKALNCRISTLPLTPEHLWKIAKENVHDCQ